MLTEHPDNPRIKIVSTLREFFDTPFSPETNAFIYPRKISGRFAEMAAYMQGKGYHSLMACPKYACESPFFDFKAEFRLMKQDGEMIEREGFRHSTVTFLHTIFNDPHLFHRDRVSSPRGRILCCYNGEISSGGSRGTEWVRNEDATLDEDGHYRAVSGVPIHRFPVGALTRHAGEIPGIPPFIHRKPLENRQHDGKYRGLLVAQCPE